MNDSFGTPKNKCCRGERSGHSSGRKKRLSLDTSLPETENEIEYRKKLFPDPGRVLKEKLRCTACSKSLLKHVMKGQELYFHPLLRVLVCQDCREFYDDGEFSVDEDNSDTYCRWCAQGGSLYCCSACSFVFCKPCIRRNFKRSMLEEIEEEDWQCFVCNPEALWKQRAICWAAVEFVKTIPRRDDKDNEEDEEEVSEKETKRRGRSKKKMEKLEDKKKRSPRQSTSKTSTESPAKDRGDNVKAMRKIFRSMDEITSTAQHTFSKSSKSLKILNEWIAKKNNSPKKEAPTSEEKTKKMVESCKKILLSVQEKISKWLEEVTTVEESWTEKKDECDEESIKNQEAPTVNIEDTVEKTSIEEDIDEDKESIPKKDSTEENEISLSKEISKTSSAANISFDLFEDYPESPLAIPIPKFDSDTDNESVATIPAPEYKCETEIIDIKKEEDVKDTVTTETESTVSLRKISSDNDKERDDKEEVSGAEENDSDSKKNGPCIEMNETDNKDYESEKEIDRIRPSKADCDAKLQFMLDSCSSDEKESKENLPSKRRHLKDSTESSDSDSDSSVKQNRTVNRKGKFSIISSLVSAFEDEKIKAGCFVQLEMLKEDEMKDIDLAQTVDSGDKEDNLDKDIKRLANLSSLKKKKTVINTESEAESDNDLDLKKKKSDSQSNGKTSRRRKKIKLPTSNSGSEGDSSAEEENDSSGDKLKGSKEDKGMDDLAKEMLADSLSSNFDLSEGDEEDDKKKKKKKDKKVSSCSEDEKKKDKKVSSSSEDEKKKEKKNGVTEDDEKESESNNKENGKGGSSSEEEMRISKRKRKDDKLLRMKLSETDSSEEEKKWRKKKERLQKLSDSEEEEDSKNVKTRKKHHKRVSSSGSEALKSSSDSSDSSDFENNSTKRKRAVKSSSSDENAKKTQKRRRIKTLKDSSSDEAQETKEDDEDDKSGMLNKGRKNIRKVLKGNRLGEETVAAGKEEEERRKRIAERQKLYNEMFTDQRNLETLEKLVLDFEPETKEELVSVDPDLVKKLKPHQAEGVKFMWDACFESLKRMEKEKGSGCILAHCMGLGKTLQVIALVHTLLNNPKTKINTVLVICPLNTVLNWVNEFKIWLNDLGTGEDIEVFELTKFKGNAERMYQLKEWQRVGGVLIIGYDMFRLLATPSRRARKKVQETFTSTLVDPGPDLVICDEGHLLKNIQSALSKAVNGIKTTRRIVLTGTPLQNNLKEYHCMIQFVKPSLLGTHKEFLNRFVNPISNGQCADSTPHDVRVMKRRAHVLHKMLEGCVQRCDYSVLTPFLPPKHEYVVLIRLTELQSKLYIYYLENLSQRSNVGGARLFNDFQNLQRIWTHPRVIKMSAEREEKKKLLQSDSEGSLKDFIVYDDESDTTESSSGSNEVQVKKRKKMKRSCKAGNSSSESSDVVCLSDKEKTKKSEEGDEEAPKLPEQKEWWEEFVQPEDHDKIMYSGKLILLMDILQKCELIGDKVLVFSQSLYALDLIEHFLSQVDENTQNRNSESLSAAEDTSITENTPSTQNEEPSLNFLGSWAKGLDYFRIDGSVSGENRSIWCKQFNKESNSRGRLFLISTRAGGMGINLVGANRVILFDASWNPSSDMQSIFRIYRFGQNKPCYVYRFLAQGTMEEKIYNRQVTKLSLASRVLDEHQIERHFNFEDLQELYRYDPNEKNKRSTPMLPKDRMLAELIQKYPNVIDSYHEHDSLLENKAEEELTEEERKAAWEEFENEKKLPEIMTNAMPDLMVNQLYANQINEVIPGLLETFRRENPHATQEQLRYQLQVTTGRLSQYFNHLDQQQQMFKQMTQHNAMDSQYYQRFQQPMQNPYNLQHYYHNPLLPSTSRTVNPSMMMNQNANNANHFMPRVGNEIPRPMLPQKNDVPTNVPSSGPAPKNPQDGSAKLKIRQDLMPTQTDDIIID